MRENELSEDPVIRFQQIASQLSDATDELQSLVRALREELSKSARGEADNASRS